jgi:RNA polymerase sigma-70 factor (ECF subfamily)
MTTANETLTSASNHEQFEHLTSSYSHELLVHCYRILGSIQDAEDALQECLLRAWRRLDTLKDQNSLRAWLYRIATNVALDMLDSRRPRLMPPLTHPAADPQDALPAPIDDPLWLEPLPDSYADGIVSSPEARYEAKESLTLAFLTVLQKLPARQRVILILRDVMGWKTQEVAELLNLSIPAVNSALQRARATINKEQPGRHIANAVDKETSQLLTRYVQAWEATDSARLIALLREDAILTMPPFPAWFRGQAAIKAFLDTQIFVGRAVGHFRLVATTANSTPAFVVYEADDSGDYHPGALRILTIENDRIARIDDFLALKSNFLSRFNLTPIR